MPNNMETKGKYIYSYHIGTCSLCNITFASCMSHFTCIVPSQYSWKKECNEAYHWSLPFQGTDRNILWIVFSLKLKCPLQKRPKLAEKNSKTIFFYSQYTTDQKINWKGFMLTPSKDHVCNSLWGCVLVTYSKFQISEIVNK